MYACMKIATQIEFATTMTQIMTWKVVHASKFHPIETYFNTNKQVIRYLKEER
jgi:hypothetical protein